MLTDELRSMVAKDLALTRRSLKEISARREQRDRMTDDDDIEAATAEIGMDIDRMTETVQTATRLALRLGPVVDVANERSIERRDTSTN